jgi:hypothetical protein
MEEREPSLSPRSGERARERGIFLDGLGIVR